MKNEIKEKIISKLTTLEEDCTSQIYSLEVNLMNSWDCNDIGNWTAMSDNITDIIELLKREVQMKKLVYEVLTVIYLFLALLLAYCAFFRVTPIELIRGVTVYLTT